MTIAVRPVTQEELPAYIDTISTAFLERPDIQRVAREVVEIWDLDRTWAAFDGDRLCATFRSWATDMTVPGGRQLPSSAVSAVTVLPSHRRRGVLRAMAAAEHAAIRERGEVAGLLYASEYAIYGRFGYGHACRVASWTLYPRTTRFHGVPAGRVELVNAGEQARDQMSQLYEAWRLRQPGELRRRDYRWDYDLGLRESGWQEMWKGYLAFHRDEAGDVDGYVRYRAKEKWDLRQPSGELTVDELHALNERAYDSLWRFLAEIDLIATIKAEGRTLSERLPWLLTNARAAVPSDVGDGLWVRLFDLPRAFESRTYEREGAVVLEVIDPEGEHSRQRLLLDAGPSGASCRPTTSSPDLTLHVAALGAAYLGGTRLRDAVLAHGFDEHRAGALHEAELLLRTADEPWCSTFF